MFNLTLFNDIMKIPSPTGNEKKFAGFLKEHFNNKGMDIQHDNMNDIFINKNGAGKRTAICVTIDEPSLMMLYINDTKFIKFTSDMVDLDKKNIMIRFDNGTKGKVVKQGDKSYVVADEPDHVMPGDLAVIDGTWASTNDIVKGRSIIYKIPALVLSDIIESDIKTNRDLYFVFSTHSFLQETNYRGLKRVIEEIQPEEVILIQCNAAGKEEAKIGEIGFEVGGKNYRSSLKMRESFIQIANLMGISYSTYVSDKSDTMSEKVLENVDAEVLAISLPWAEENDEEVMIVNIIENAADLVRKYISNIDTAEQSVREGKNVKWEI